MRGIAAVAGAALLAGIASANPESFEEVLADFEARMVSYLGDTPEDLANKDRTADRRALVKAIAAIHRVQEKPGPLAIARVVGKQDRALTKEIPNGEMQGHLDQVAANLQEVADLAVADLLDRAGALPPQAARDRLLLSAGGLKDALDEASTLLARADRLKALGKGASALVKLEKKYAGLVKRLQGSSYIAAEVNGVPFESRSVLGTMIVDPDAGGVVSVLFSASAPAGNDQETILISLDTGSVGGALDPGPYEFGNDPPVAEALYGRIDSMGAPVAAVVAIAGTLVITALDAAGGSLAGTFFFDDGAGTVSGGTFYVTGLTVVTPPP